MDWTLYAEIRALLDSQDTAGALRRLSAIRRGGARLEGPLVGLEAQGLMAHGEAAQAAAALREVAAFGDDDYWTWYLLAQACRHLEDWPGTFAASQQAHARLGWAESAAHGYAFTHDYFSSNVPDWQRWFAEHIRAAPVACLEIGSWQGGSSCWLLDRVVGPRGGRLTCIDPFEGSSEHAGFLAGLEAQLGRRLETLFDANIARTGQAHLVRKLVGLSEAVLPKLHAERFDFIYIDGAHEARFVIQDAILCWQILAPRGFMLFDDVPFRFAGRPQQDTARAIDFFLSVFEDEVSVIERGRQLLLQRR